MGGPCSADDSRTAGGPQPSDGSQQVGGLQPQPAGDSQPAGDPRPIGVFDSGFGGLTVLRQLIRALPHESFVFFGDRGRCPYGPRSQAQVNLFVQQICEWFVGQGVKMIVIACNTATAAGLAEAQKRFDVPVLGVIEPGARAAVQATENRRVGVIATQGTIDSGSYTRAIRRLDDKVTVFSAATPRFVEMAEKGLRMEKGPLEDYIALASHVYIRPEFRNIAKDYLEPLRRAGVDTLVLACTHFPLLRTLIGGVMGNSVKLVDSGFEVSRDASQTLMRAHELAPVGSTPEYRFFCSGPAQDEFKEFGSRVLQMYIEDVGRVDFPMVGEGL